MASNLLALPFSTVSFVVGNNEDWVDTIAYQVNVTGNPQMDLRGINFDMEIRRAASENEVILSASTADGSLTVGAPPNVGYLIWYVPQEIMQYIVAGNYVGDVRGNDGLFERTVLLVNLVVREGVTK